MSDINSITKASAGGFTRLLTGFGLGLGMVGVLFWGMQAMIKMADVELNKDESFKLVDFVQVTPDNSPVKKRKPPEKPPRPDKPPKQPPPPKIDNPNVKANTISVSAGQVDAQVELNDAGFSVGAIGEGEYLPIVKIAPIYPPRAAERGVEGHCTIVYTVTKQGTTAGHRVDESDCTSRLFHRASINAAKKFKYKPTVRNGEAIDVPNVKNRFRYSLDN